MCNVIKKGNQCHTNLIGVMSNSGFGGTTYTNKDNIKFIIPVKGINQSNRPGAIKKSWLKRLESVSIESVNWLHERGAIITKA